MLKINKDNIWVMWPDYLVDNFIEYPSNKIFDYDGDFSFFLIFKISKPIIEKMTLFAKLPTYFGIDIENDGLLLIINEENKKTKYITKYYEWITNKQYELEIKKTKNIIEILINNESIVYLELKNTLKKDEKPHIIFGAGNFPKNGFNLNYFSGDLTYLSIKKDNELISEHKFDKFIHNKSYDLTNNCNFIHKI